jgi:hypothetical protein
MPMEPPWIAFPHIPRGRIGWRMGAGEEYASEFRRMFTSLSAVEQDAYEREHPAPSDWAHFYDQLRRDAGKAD